MACYNKNLPEYQNLMSVYDNPILVDNIITQYQNNTGTDKYPTPIEAEEILDKNKVKLNLKRREFKKAVIQNLVKKKYITGFLPEGKTSTEEMEYYVVGSNENTGGYTNPIVLANNKIKIANYLAINNIPAEVYSFQPTQNSVRFTIEENAFLPKDKIESSPDRKNTPVVLEYLSKAIPGVSYEFVDVGEAQDIYNSIPNYAKSRDKNGKAVPFSKINSFFYQGKAYIIRGRVTTDTAIEEVLHPIVDALYVSRPDIFGKLVVEARKDFPVLYQQIQDTYNAKYRFTNTDRDLELVTQALSRYFRNEFEKNPGKGLKSAMAEFLDWFYEIIQEVFRVLTGDYLPVNISQLPANTNLSKIAQLLNVEGLTFTFDVKDPIQYKVKYNISEEDPEAKRRAFAQSSAKNRAINNVQRDLIDGIYNSPVHLIEKTHTYVDVSTGETYQSTTNAIKGELSDPENLYNMNRLFGKAFDIILQDIINAKSFDEALESVRKLEKDENLTEQQLLSIEQVRDVYDNLSSYIDSLTMDGSVVLPQVIFADSATKIAGSLDILIIKPDGSLYIVDLKVSKNSSKDEAYSKVKYKVNEGSRFSTDTTLTTKQQQSLQVQTYARLAEISGFPVAGTATYHILLDIEGEGASQKVIGFRNDGVVMHYPTENLEKLDELIPTPAAENLTEKIRQKHGYNTTRDPNFLNPDEEKPEQPLTAEQYSSIASFMRDTVVQLSKRVDALQSIIDSSKQVKPKKETIDKITSLIATLSTEINSGKADIALGRFLNSSKEELEKFNKYVGSKRAIDDPNYISTVLMFSKFMTTYRGISSMIGQIANPGQQKIAIAVTDLLNIADSNVDMAIENFVKNFIKTNSTRDWTEDELEEIIKETTDISKADATLGDISTSTDTILALIDKVYKRQRQRVLDSVDQFSSQAISIGNRLASLNGGRPDFSFMLVYDKDGKFTGRYVQKIGYQYYKKLYELRNKLVDNNGEWLEYIMIPDPNNAKAADLAFNKKLFADKQAYRKFKSAEKIVDGKAEDGDYHKYTAQFKAARDKHETLTRFGWKKKRGVSDADYSKYRNKYYNYSESYVTLLIDKNGSYTGQTKVNDGWFVKPEFTEVRDVASTGEVMLDDKYTKIMNPQTELERAQRDFYLFWVEQFENNTLAELPPSTKRKMLGKLPRIYSNAMEKVKAEPTGFLRHLTKAAKNWVSSILNTGYQKTVLTDENGDLIDAPPVFYVGDLKSQAIIDKIKADIDSLNNQFSEGKISTTKYREQSKLLNSQLRSAESRISADEISTDLVDSLIRFKAMSSNYQHMLNIDDTIFALKRVVENREYTQSEKTFVKVGTTTKLKTVPGTESRTATRLKKWLKMTYYQEKEFDKTITDNIINKIVNGTSLAYVGFNVFANINNYLIGRINNGIETGGELFYKRKAMQRAVSVYNGEYLPGVFKGLSKSGGYYSDKKPQSKYEALMNKFRIVDTIAYREAKEEKKGLLDWGYFLQDASENNVQSKVGIAMLMSESITNDNGDTLSIYDAYDFDPNTGELTLKDGFSLTDDERYDVRNKIREANKQIHGNYSAEDRAALQDESIGVLIFQFHKWVYPAFKARFKKRYYDENLGWIEGRYRTFGTFIANFYTARGSMMEKIRDAKGSLTEDQLKNISRTMTELGFIMASFALAHIIASLIDGADFDDDDKQLKRLLNALSYQADRQTKELLQWVNPKDAYMLVKSPISSSKFLGELGEAIADTALFPYDMFVDPESLYYQRGARKGELKLNKEWADALPVFYTINRWRSYDTVTDFFVR